MSAGVTVPAAALPLWMRLQLAVLDAGAVPCCGKSSDLWTSDQPEDREAAAHRCAGCPASDACDAYATAAREKFGVWAGRDRTRTPGRPTRTNHPRKDKP